jgi:hypothetical protein
MLMAVQRPDEAGPSRPPKQPHLEHRFHGDLQKDARALVILLQVGVLSLVLERLCLRQVTRV